MRRTVVTTVLVGLIGFGAACTKDAHLNTTQETDTSSSTPTTTVTPPDDAPSDDEAVPSDVAGPPKDAFRTPSGLASKVLRRGTGLSHPTADSTVTVHYTGWTTDGRMFDSSIVRGATATFPLRGVIAGWTEGLQLMVVGEKRRLWIPEALAYKGRPGPPAGMLVFDVELISFE
jgi:FKBP-type peptidyl-prolyl cis-trans isomerase